MNTALLVAVWLPQGISRALSSATYVALSLYLFDLTGSALVLASVLAVSMMASIYASPFVGGIADHLPKRAVLLFGNLLLAAQTLVLGWAVTGEHAIIWLMYAVMLLSGAVDAVVVITQQAAIRDVVSDAQLVRANAWVAFLQNSPVILGPAVGAALYTMVPFWGIIVANSVTFVIAGGCALFLPYSPARSPKGGWLRVPFSGAREGLGNLWRDPDMRMAQSFYSLANVGNGLGSGILAAYILENAVQPEPALGAFGTAGALGMVAASLLLATTSLPGRRSDWVILGLIGAALAGRAPILAGPVVAGLVGIALVGFARSFLLELSNAPLLAIWQQATPREMQGRIFGARRLLAQAPYPIAVWAGGWLAEHLPSIEVASSPGTEFDPAGLVIGLGVLVELVAAAGLAVSGCLRRLEGGRHAA